MQKGGGPRRPANILAANSPDKARIWTRFGAAGEAPQRNPRYLDGRPEDTPRKCFPPEGPPCAIERQMRTPDRPRPHARCTPMQQRGPACRNTDVPLQIPSSTNAVVGATGNRSSCIGVRHSWPSLGERSLPLPSLFHVSRLPGSDGGPHRILKHR